MPANIPHGARVSQAGVASESGAGGKTFGLDDKAFRLERTRLSDCLPITHDPKKRAAMRRAN